VGIELSIRAPPFSQHLYGCLVLYGLVQLGITTIYAIYHRRINVKCLQQFWLRRGCASGSCAQTSVKHCQVTTQIRYVKSIAINKCNPPTYIEVRLLIVQMFRDCKYGDSKYRATVILEWERLYERMQYIWNLMGR
jgi:hypothetical protein